MKAPAVEKSPEESEVEALEIELAQLEAEELRLDRSPSVLRRKIEAQRAENEEKKRWEAFIVKHGPANVGRVRTPLGAFYLRRGSSDAWDRYTGHVKDAVAKDQTVDEEHTKDLVRACRGEPSDEKGFEQLLGDQPAALGALVGVCARLYGAHASF